MLWRWVLQGLHQLREISGHGFLVAAADLHLIPVAENDGPEAVPLWFVAQVAVRHTADGFGEHGRNGRHHGKVHSAHSCPATAAAKGLRRQKPS